MRLENLNPPNALSFSRMTWLMGLAAYFLWIKSYEMALFWYTIGALTDLLDGWLARRFEWVTEFGKVFDPFADKIFFTGILGVLSLREVPSALLPSLGLLLVFEGILLTTGIYRLLRWIYSRTPMQGSNRFGKIKVWGEVVFTLVIFYSILGYISLEDPYITFLCVYLLLGTTFLAALSIYGYLSS